MGSSHDQTFLGLEDDLLSWPSPQLLNELGNGFRSATYSDAFTSADAFTSTDTKLPDYSNNFPKIFIGEGSSTEAELQLRNLPEFPSLPSPSSHDAVTAHHSRGLPAGVIPGPHSRTEHEQPQEPLQTRGYPMHSYESPLNTEDPDYKKNPEAMRNNWMADYRRFVDDHKVLKIFSKHAKSKVATVNTINASVARRTNPAKFKCTIRGCSADFTRKHNLESEFDSLFIFFYFLSAHLRHDACHFLCFPRSLEVALRRD